MMADSTFSQYSVFHVHFSCFCFAGWRMKRCWTEERPLSNTSATRRKWKVRGTHCPANAAWTCPSLSLHTALFKKLIFFSTSDNISAQYISVAPACCLSAEATEQCLWRHPHEWQSHISQSTTPQKDKCVCLLSLMSACALQQTP